MRLSTLARAGAAALTSALLPACSGGPDAPGGEPVLEATAALRPDTPGNNEIYNFDPGDVVETFGSMGGSFLVHFTRMGKNAVPAADADASGVPDFVEEVAATYDEVTALYQGALGFRAPASDEALSSDNGGDARFDVYLVDFNGAGDGVFRPDGCLKDKPAICAGYMVQENDYKGYGYPSTKIANRILGSHEFFHAVQAAYDDGQDSVIREGSAVWATERFDPSLKDFESFTGGFLENPDRTLNEPLPGPVDPFSYGSCVFFQFLSERYGESTVRSLWERCEDGANGAADPYWFTELDPLFQKEAGSSFAEAYVEFATWNLFTGAFADPARSYDAGDGYASVKMFPATAPYKDDLLRVFQASSQYYRIPVDGRGAVTAAVVPPSDAPEEADGLEILLAVERGSSLDPVLRVADKTAGTEVIDAKGADNFIVVVVNTRQEGPSRRPGLCAGSVDEVKTCKDALVPPVMETPDGGAPDAGSPAPPAEETGGCECTLTRPARSTSPAALFALFALAGVTRLWRRRRPHE